MTRKCKYGHVNVIHILYCWKGLDKSLRMDCSANEYIECIFSAHLVHTLT